MLGSQAEVLEPLMSELESMHTEKTAKTAARRTSNAGLIQSGNGQQSSGPPASPAPGSRPGTATGNRTPMPKGVSSQALAARHSISVVR